MDIETKLKLKMGFAQAKSMQDYQIMATIVSAAFGGKKKSKPAQSFAEAERQFESIFGK